MDAGTITNTATASGTPPTGAAVTSDPSTATVTVDQSAGISLAKTADPTVVHAAGDAVTYTFTITNTGRVTLHDVAVTEQSFTGSGTLSAPDCPDSTLAPQVTVGCTASYVVTAHDMTTDAISNTAVAVGVVGSAQESTFAADLIAPGTTVSSQASTARVAVEPTSVPTPPSGGGSGTAAVRRAPVACRTPVRTWPR